jgi:diguanylate cyclase (GGDEF)-like protein
LLSLCCAGRSLAGPTLGQQVEAIEAAYGNEPQEVVARLKPLEAGARAAGGDSLRIFLAAWGYAHGTMDQFTVADTATAELIEMGERQGNAGAMASAFALRATMLQLTGRLNAAYDWIAAAVPWAEKTQDEPLRYWVDMLAGTLALRTGRLQEGLRFYEAADRAALAQGVPRRSAQARLALAPMRVALGDLARARVDAQEAYRLAEQADSLALRVAARLTESLVEGEAGDDAAQARAHEQARQLAVHLEALPAGGAAAVNPASGGPRWLSTQAEGVQQLSELHLSVRNFEPARAYAERALRLARRESDADALDLATISLGLAQLGLQRPAEGDALVAAGLSSLERRSRKVQLLEQLNRHADLLEYLGDGVGALRQSRKALALEAELVRSDRLNTVLDLQRQSSFEQHQRALDALRHDNELQASQLARHDSERRLTLGLVAAMISVIVLTVALHQRVRRANRALRAHNDELAHVGLHDRVTGLPNRRAIEQHVQALEAQGFVGMAIMIKRYGLIMSSLGHAVGDELLCQLAARLGPIVEGHGGTLFRLDGLSFGVVVPSRAEPLDTASLLDELIQSTRPVFMVQRQQLAVTISIGVAEYPRHGQITPDVARAIQVALRHAQVLPGNAAVIYTDDLMLDQQDRLQLETRLSQALDKGELELFYQAQCDLAGRRLTGFEALLRWRSPEGLIPPDRFIPVAEECGLIVPIGRWVLQQACRQAKAWHDAGLGRPMMAINISPRQFQHPDFMAMVREALDSSGVDPRLIELEITEGAVMDDAEATIAKMAELRQLGLHLAIDDFGTGYSSLAYLKRFPINRLKIDRSFIQCLGRQGEDAAIVQALIQLAHSLGMSVVAEGVEESGQEDCLRDWGCDLMQGFGYARPTPVQAATALLVANQPEATQAQG